jgi:hypothetical protein
VFVVAASPPMSFVVAASPPMSFVVAASPPDVRQGFALPLRLNTAEGSALGSGSALGRSPKFNITDGEA